MNSLDNFKVIKNELNKLKSNCNLLVVTKNRTFETILPIISSGHRHFAENKVQEAKLKWATFLDNKKNDVELHLVGKLQSNKAKEAFTLFDYIHTLDSIKLARIFSELEKNSIRRIKYFIQINIGNELFLYILFTKFKSYPAPLPSLSTDCMIISPTPEL